LLIILTANTESILNRISWFIESYWQYRQSSVYCVQFQKQELLN